MLSGEEIVRKNRRQHQRGKHYIWCVASGKSTTYSVCLEGCTMLVNAVKTSLVQGQDWLAPGSVGGNVNRGFEGTEPSAARLSRRFARLGRMKYEKNCASARSANALVVSMRARVSIEIIFQPPSPWRARSVISGQHPRANPHLVGHWRGPPVPSQNLHPGQPCGPLRCAHGRPGEPRGIGR